ncbi:hypothetical protein BC829DRAFT_441415 [Chytridium lagenaria]|nr:hypothetical protein BC829DRAFT_441415 [Chytridium lagenaria]
MNTQPVIATAVSDFGTFAYPGLGHWNGLLRVFRYLKATPTYANAAIAWSSTKTKSVALSATEAE